MSSSISSTSENLIETEKIGNVFMIGINRPKHRNAVNPETAQQLIKAFKQFEADKDSLVAVLHGKGGNFCAGFDLKALSQLDNTNFSLKDPKSSDEAPMGPSRMLFSKPVIGAISGYAVAGGMELALLCDLRIMEESAVMGVFCRRFGVPLIDGGTVRLPQLIGLSRAMDLILTGRPIRGKEALEFGLANQLVATGTALGRACQLASNIAQFPQECMLTDRRSVYNSVYNSSSIKNALQFEYVEGIKVISTESIAGAQKFTSGIGKHGSFILGKPSKL
ncbi:hypothetical protein SNE40_021579 [Patella caerulea]|uniref:Enoyl-CoA hydratase n=2 Tax=Patella caerulea TaxID=87958 RepID=A0AAN8GGS6_PATCE